jgi:hypothetical protein
MGRRDERIIIAQARKLVGVAEWKYAARWHEAPDFVDCSSLTQWLYGEIGINIPRRSHEQMSDIVKRENLNEARVGDLLFVSSPYIKGKKTVDQTGLHVCLIASKETIICATHSELGCGVVEIDLKRLLRTREFRAVGKPREIQLDDLEGGWLDENGDYRVI